MSLIKLTEKSNFDNLYIKPVCHVVSKAFSLQVMSSLYNLEAGQKLGTGRDSWWIVRRYCWAVNTTLPGYQSSQHVGGLHGRLPHTIVACLFHVAMAVMT
jgi:hypothetical protein